MGCRRPEQSRAERAVPRSGTLGLPVSVARGRSLSPLRPSAWTPPHCCRASVRLPSGVSSVRMAACSCPPAARGPSPFFTLEASAGQPCAGFSLQRVPCGVTAGWAGRRAPPAGGPPLQGLLWKDGVPDVPWRLPPTASGLPEQRRLLLGQGRGLALEVGWQLVRDDAASALGTLEGRRHSQLESQLAP